MVTLLSFPMISADRRLYELRDLLALIPGDGLVWSLFEFSGFGVGPDGTPLDAFEATVTSSPLGYVLAWPRLLDFARGIRQTVDCALVAVERAGDLTSDAPERGLGEFVIVGVDCSVWEVSGRRFGPGLEDRFRTEFP
ncbi:hypothetical protein VSH64_31080 [Amycolatopsis rhabdoformis]|uniref:Uncharacterized protein n=1 Tax=Amycolatopsis rhabdoformis TaxID=1448059 RepID=A0ABZ1I060_9PSEU|nr:hypothetical protein [Amycolatopsis rhabdoformis]WSE27291.1 hypothetical protein VSH64_31080 [Amycolatopsis rhabdoformis]